MKTLYVQNNRVVQVTLASDLVRIPYAGATAVDVPDGYTVSVGDAYTLPAVAQLPSGLDPINAAPYLGERSASWLAAENTSIAAGSRKYPADTTVTVNGMLHRTTGTAAFQPSASGGGGGTVQVPYSTTIPLDSNKLMPRTAIAGAVALTIGAKVAGGQCRIPFVSNGANVPSLTGASEWATSFGFDNSQAGMLNVLDVWCDDGINVGFAWSQPAVQSPSDTTAPTISGVTVNGATMVVTYSETLPDTPSASAYTVRNAGGAATQTPSNVARSGAVVTLTLGTPAVSGNTVTLDVAAGAVADAAGNGSAAVSGRAVTNNTPVPGVDNSVAVTLSTLRNLTNEGSGVYLATSSNFASNGLPGALFRAANTEAYIECAHEVAADSAVVLSFHTEATPTATSTAKFQLQLSTAAGNIRGGTDSAIGAATVIQALAGAAGTFARLWVTATGVCTVQVSVDSKATWTSIATLGTYTGALYPLWSVGVSGNRLRGPRQFGLA